MIKKTVLLFLISTILLNSCNKKVYQNNSVRNLKTGTLLEMNTEAFLVQNNTWNLKTTEHFKFYFDISISDSLKHKVVTVQEKNYKKLVKLMSIENRKLPTVTYFLFKDKAQKTQLTQVEADAHKIENNVYHLPKNALGKQEVGHIITHNAWGFIPNDSDYALIVDEGFNYYVDEKDFYDMDFYDFVKNVYNKNPDFTLNYLVSEDRGKRINGGHDQILSYIAGGFTKYLIKHYGISKFEKLWAFAREGKDSIYKEIYNKTLTELDSDFKKYLFR